MGLTLAGTLMPLGKCRSRCHKSLQIPAVSRYLWPWGNFGLGLPEGSPAHQQWSYSGWDRRAFQGGVEWDGTHTTGFQLPSNAARYYSKAFTSMPAKKLAHVWVDPAPLLLGKGTFVPFLHRTSWGCQASARCSNIHLATAAFLSGQAVLDWALRYFMFWFIGRKTKNIFFKKPSLTQVQV